MKIHPVGDELFFADRQTDMTKLIVASQNFSNAPKSKYRAIQNDCRNFNNFSYTIHLR